MQKIAVGVQDFETLRINGYFYVDKTEFIREWWESGDSVTLINRLRRFGKTLMMSMTEQFFQRSTRDGRNCLKGFRSGKMQHSGRFRERIR